MMRAIKFNEKSRNFCGPKMIDIEGHGLVVTCDPSQIDQAKWLLTECARIEGLEPNQTVSVGWTTFKMVSDGKRLRLLQPDYESDPFNLWSNDVSVSIDVLVSQSTMLRRCRLEGLACTFKDKIVLTKGALERDDIYLERSEASPGDSGWYIGPSSGERGELSAIYSYELLKARPALTGLLFLPAGTVVIVKASRIVEIADAQDRVLYPPRL